MWKLWLRIKGRLATLSIWASFFVPGIGFSATGFCMVGWILIGISALLMVYVILRPLKVEIPPRHIAVRNSRVVWGLWFTGDFMRTEGLIQRYSSVKRILLLEPDSPAFKTTLEITGASKEQPKKEILMLTKQATERGIDVRWYSRHEGIGLTIYDPLNDDEPISNKAWCVVQILKPNVPREERPLYMGKNVKRGEAYFKGKFNKFMEIWTSDELSRKPEKEEYEGVEMQEDEQQKVTKQKRGITKKVFQALLDRASQPIKKSEEGKS